jgi:hypothetical protein
MSPPWRVAVRRGTDQCPATSQPLLLLHGRRTDGDDSVRVMERMGRAIWLSPEQQAPSFYSASV